MHTFHGSQRKWMLALLSIYLILQFDGLFPLARFYRTQNFSLYRKVNEQKTEGNNWIMVCGSKLYPLLAYAGENPVTELTVEEKEMLEQILQAEALEGIEMVVEDSGTDTNQNQTGQQTTGEQGNDGYQLDEQAAAEIEQAILDEIREENQVAQNQVSTAQSGIGTGEKRQQFRRQDFADYDTILKRFYTVDHTTEPFPEQITYENLMEKDMALSHKNSVGEAPQILIYHTHSQEQFVDSIPGDMATGVVGAGEYLTQILEQQYGYQVLHHLGTYDVNGREHAYSNAEPEIQKLLEENPQIEVVIDLHRDAVAEGRKLVTTIDGVTMAKFMFFNGLSYTRELGRITYLDNPYIDENLAFAFQMEVTAESYYPDITRKIYLKGYRYNMHFTGKSLLIELGAQTNTMQEIWNAIPPIAATLDRVLSGQEPVVAE